MRRFESIPLALIFLLAALTGSSSASELEIQLLSSETQLAIVDTLSLSIAYINAGESTFYFERTNDLGEFALDIVASNGGCEFKVSPVHLDMPKGAWRFKYVPLQPGDELRTRLLPLNEPGSGLLLAVPSPGKYFLEAHLTSTGGPVYKGLKPVWRGTIKSNPIELDLLPPRPEVVDAWIQRLNRCHEGQDCDLLAVTEFFEMIRVKGVSRIFREILDRDPTSNLIVGRALASQGELESATFLRNVAKENRVSASNRESLLYWIEEIEKRQLSGCWPAPSDWTD